MSKQKRFEKVFKINEKVPKKWTFESLTSGDETKILGGPFFTKLKIFLKRFRGERDLHKSAKKQQKMLVLSNDHFLKKIQAGSIFFHISLSDLRWPQNFCYTRKICPTNFVRAISYYSEHRKVPKTRVMESWKLSLEVKKNPDEKYFFIMEKFDFEKYFWN